MPEKLRKVYFGFTLADREAARQWLEEQAADGWELVKLKEGRLSWAYFRPLERLGLRYCVDVADCDLKDPEQQLAYDQLAADAGWELIGRLGGLNGMKVYKSLPGRDPAPLQTDPELERRRYWRQVRLPGLAWTALLLVLAALMLWGLRRDGPLHLYHFFLSNGSLLLLCVGAAALVWTLWSATAALLRRRSRRAPPPERVRRRRLGGQVLSWALSLVCTASLLLQIPLSVRVAETAAPGDGRAALFVEDLGLSGTAAWGRDRGDSLLLREHYTMQHLGPQGGGGLLYQDRYVCRSPWVAGLVLSALVRDEENGLRRTGDADHVPGALTPAELGFDQSYLAQYGPYQCLILRQGRVVVLLEGPVDFTAHLPTLWDTLHLEV